MLIAKGRNNDKASVQKLQEGLAAFGYHPGSADGIFGQKTEDALEDWQEAADLYADGMFGKDSAAAWDKWCDDKKRPEYKFGIAIPVTADPAETCSKLSWKSVPADPLKGGFKNLTLREDVGDAHNRLRDAVNRKGGLVTTAGGKRGLSSGGGASQSKKSFHYVGRAFDLALPTGMNDTKTDAYIVVRDSMDSRYFTVWAKVMNDKAPEAASVPVVELLACTVSSKKNSQGKWYTQLAYTPWKGKAFNFTEMAAAEGFERISGRKSFFKGGSSSGAEWWHHQYTKGLVAGQTTFGDELLRVYSLAECKKFIFWSEAKDAAYKVDWF